MSDHDLFRHARMHADLRRSSGQGAGLAYNSMDDLLVRHGRLWTPDAVPPKWAGLFDMPKQCFDNAFRLASKSRGALRYAEGYAVGKAGIPVHHAWCIDDTGLVVDPTWGHGTAYLGVVVPVATVKVLRTRENLSALLDYVHGFPLLREPFEHPQDV